MSSSLHTYTDLHRKYLQEPGDALVYDVDAIIESIDNILNTPYMTRGFNRAFGSRLLSVLFQPLGQQSADALLESVISALSVEPRIYVDTHNSYSSPNYDNSSLEIFIVFRILFNGQIGRYNRTFKVQQ